MDAFIFVFSATRAVFTEFNSGILKILKPMQGCRRRAHLGLLEPNKSIPLLIWVVPLSELCLGIFRALAVKRKGGPVLWGSGGWEPGSPCIRWSDPSCIFHGDCEPLKSGCGGSTCGRSCDGPSASKCLALPEEGAASPDLPLPPPAWARPNCEESSSLRDDLKLVMHKKAQPSLSATKCSESLS